MYFLSMNYFNGINFISWGGSSDYRCAIQQRFDGYYGIQYNHSGTCDFSLDGLSRKTISGSFVLLTYPGPTFHYGAPPGKSRSHHYICFNGPRVEDYLKTDLLPLNRKNPIIEISHPDSFMITYQELVACLETGTSHYQRGVHLLEGLLLQLHGRGENKPASSYLVPLLKELTDKIRATPVVDWEFRKEAVRMRISYPHLRRVFQQYTGCPPGQFLIACRLSLAAQLLRHSDSSIAGIAEQVGIDDAFYFSKLFKKHYQLPPSVYRQEFNMIN